MKLSIAAAQYPIIAFNHFAQWQRHARNWVSGATRRGAQLLLFPEYGSMELASLLAADDKRDLRKNITGLAPLKDDFLEVFSGLARQKNVIIVAPSFPVMEGDQVYNRAFVCSPKGLVGYQDKLLMTRFEDEEWGIQAAAPTLKVFEADWGAFGIQICYDVEFSVGAHALCMHGADLILAPSCTETIQGATRVHIGARARALENQCYVAVAQTVGKAHWSPAVDISYGFAAVYSTPDTHFPEDGVVAQMSPQKPGWLVQEIDFEKIKLVRREGQVFNYQDHERVEYRLRGEELKIIKERV